MTIIISPAPRARLHAIMEASKQTDAEHRQRQPFAFPGNVWEQYLKSSFEDAFLGSGGETLDHSPSLFIAEVDGLFAGYVLLSWWVRPDGPDHINGSIDDIRVFEGFRGQGVSDALIAKARDAADDRGWHSLTAQVWAENEASTALFKRSGFAPQSTIYRIGPNTPSPDLPDNTPLQDSPDRSHSQFWIWLWVALGLVVLIVMAQL